MRRKILKYEKFLVWIFTADYYGDSKLIKPEECNRGLTDYGPTTFNTIAVFTKGSWTTLKEGGMHLNEAGSGGSRFLDSPTLDFHILVAMEEGAEYHCLVPRDHTPRFWERSVHKLIPNSGFFIVDEWIYVAKGTVETLDYDPMPELSLVNIKNDFIIAKTDAIIVRLVEPTIPA